jgi:hypothetical protein
MASARRKTAARRNIKKAQQAWKAMPKRARSLAQPQGRRRAKPGAKGGGEFLHIEVRPSGDFTTFRTQDVGTSGGIERVAGKRSSGSWDTQKWLISKSQAHREGSRLVPDTDAARRVLEDLGATPVLLQADRFKAKPRPNVPEAKKPTPAQKRARSGNIKKAQAARRGK